MSRALGDAWQFATLAGMALISKAALDLIIREEVSSKALYEKKYRRPEWPGVQSGATIGIGYDLGQTNAATVRADWQGRVPPAMLEAMVSACGATGQAGKAAAARIRSKVEIPWDLAIAVHEERVVPRWVAKVRKALPNTDQLSPDCLGALVSLTFNRGPSFSTAGARYAEMRNIKAHMAAEDFARIPGEFRAMKRLWPGVAGLQRRRDTEAKLFEKGLKAISASAESSRPPPADPPIEPEAEETASPAPVPPPAGGAEVQGDPELYHVQRRLKEMNYSPGSIDGRWGSMTAGAITSFLNDWEEEGDIPPPKSSADFRVIREDLKRELTRAEEAGHQRKLSVERKTATAETVAEKTEAIAPVKQSKIMAWLLGIGSSITAVFNGIASYFEDAWNSGFVTAVREFASDNIALIAIGVVGLAGLMWWKAKQAENATVKSYQEGRLT